MPRPKPPPRSPARCSRNTDLRPRYSRLPNKATTRAYQNTPGTS
jgi:hypothetical protein